MLFYSWSILLQCLFNVCSMRFPVVRYLSILCCQYVLKVVQCLFHACPCSSMLFNCVAMLIRCVSLLFNICSMRVTCICVRSMLLNAVRCLFNTCKCFSLVVLCCSTRCNTCHFICYAFAKLFNMFSILSHAY